MVRQLRYRHLQIWVLLSILLPSGIVASIVTRPTAPLQTMISKEKLFVHPHLIRSASALGNTIEIRGSSPNTANQLIWKNRRPLTVPSATIYLQDQLPFTPATSKYIGRVETRGDYVFRLPEGRHNYQLVVYDFIHGHILQQINITL